MKARAALLLAMVGVVALGLTPAWSQLKVLLILKGGSQDMELMLKQETGVMIHLLNEAGYQAVVATENGATLTGGQTSLRPDLKLSDVVMADYVGVLVPCMGFGTGNGLAPEGVALVRRAADLNLPIAAQNGGVEFLARAGVMSGRRFSIFTGLQGIVVGGIYAGMGVTRDGNILTSSTCPSRATAEFPDTTAELTTRFIAMLPKP